MIFLNMSAILSEYYSIIESLNRELRIYKFEQKDLKTQLLKLVEHNRKITASLKENIKLSISDKSKIENLEHQLNLQYKNHLRDVHKDQPFILQEENVSAIGKFEKKIDEVQGHYSQGVRILSRELSEAQQQLASWKSEVHEKTKELELCKTDLKDARELITSKDIDIVQLKDSFEGTKQKLRDVESDLLHNVKLLQNCTSENSDLKKANSELREQNDLSMVKTKALEQRCSFSEKKAKKLLLDVQGALLQKKAIAYKEQLALNFTETLKSSINQQVEHAVLKHKREAKAMKKECEGKIVFLMKEIGDLQIENDKKQSLFEKAVREKSAIESKITSSKGANSFVSHALFDEICFKLSQSEKARDEASLQVQTLENSFHNLQQNMLKDSKYFVEESFKMKEHIQQLKKELSNALEEKILQANKITNFRKICSDLEKQLVLLNSHKENEIQSLKKNFSRTKESFEHKLKLSKEENETNVNAVQELLKSHNHISNKWKDAFQELTIKSELKMKEMFQGIMQLQMQNEHLNNLLSSNKNK